MASPSVMELTFMTVAGAIVAVAAAALLTPLAVSRRAHSKRELLSPSQARRAKKKTREKQRKGNDLYLYVLRNICTNEQTYFTFSQLL